MKTLFVHDHKFCRIGSNIFSPGKYTYSLFADRYLPYFGEIEIIARTRQVNCDKSQFSLVSGAGISFVEFPDLSNLTSLFFPQRYYSLADELISKADCVIVRLPSEIGNLFADRARVLNVPLLVEVVACAFDGLNSIGSLSAKAYAPLAFYRMKNQLSLAKYSSYVTSEFLQKRYPTQGYSVAVSDVEIPLHQESVSARRLSTIDRSSSEKRPLRLGLIGGIENRTKGVADGIRALRILVDHYPDTTFEIVGQGDQTPYKILAKSLNIEDKVIFHGSIGTKEGILSFIDNNIDIYIHPSYMEGLPRAIIEAMSRACPIVASTVGGIPELIDAQYLHSPGNYTELANKILIMWENKNILLEQARTNFIHSMRFQSVFLEKIRKEFINNFLDQNGLQSIKILPNSEVQRNATSSNS